MDAIVVGIDVSKDKLDIAVLPQGQTFAISRDTKGLDGLIARLKPLAIEAVAVEATGGFEAVVAASLAAEGLPVIVVNPAQVRAFAKALGQRAKTDPIDAMVIARFAMATKPEIRPLPDEAPRFLNDLVCRRRQIIEMIVAEKQRAMRLSNKRLQQSIARLIKALEKELAGLDTDIDARYAVRRPGASPGVGKSTVRTLLAVVPELGALRAGEAGSIVGCAPFTRQSGLWKGKSFISGGRPAARSALFLSALVAMRHNAQMKGFYERLVGAGKAKKVALIAGARKLAVLLNAILRDKRPWRFSSNQGLAYAEASI